MNRGRIAAGAWTLIVALLFAACLPNASPDTETTPLPTATATATSAPATTPTPAFDCDGELVGGRVPDIPELEFGQLVDCRPEAGETHALILSDGPFPYRQDDETFQNREGYLPPDERGAYREYTIVTPGADTRGARRFVANGEPGRDASDYEALYYTDDHYDTFWLVVEDGE